MTCYDRLGDAFVEAAKEMFSKEKIDKMREDAANAQGHLWEYTGHDPHKNESDYTCSNCGMDRSITTYSEPYRAGERCERRISEFVAGGAENTALKADDGKLRYDLLSPEFEEQMALALTHGAKKYDDRNYLKGDGLELKRPLAALRRHLAALLKGQDTDEDSKAHHAACVAVNAMFLYDLMTKKGKKF